MKHTIKKTKEDSVRYQWDNISSGLTCIFGNLRTLEKENESENT